MQISLLLKSGLPHPSIVKILVFLKASRRQGKEWVLLYDCEDLLSTYLTFSSGDRMRILNKFFC